METPTYSRKSRSKIKVGDRFERVVVQRDLGTFRSSAAGAPRPTYSRRFECLCACGKLFETWGSALRNHAVKSCGCLNLERISTPRLKDGEAAVRMVLRSYEANAKNRGILFALTREQMLSLMQARCFYCDVPPSLEARSKGGDGSFIYNGIDRVDNAQGYTFENVVTCCKTCNIAKQAMTVPEFLAWAARVTAHAARGRQPLLRLVNPVSG